MSLIERIDDFINDKNHHIENAKTSDYKDNYVKNLYICRKPVQKIILDLIKLLNSDFKKLLKDERYTYDKIFHLYLIIQLDNNVFIRTEKNPRIIFKYIDEDDFKTNDYYQIKCYNFSNKCTFYDLIIECQKRMGENYDKYESITNNCQTYVLNMIESFFSVIHVPMPDVYKKYIYLDIPQTINKFSNNDVINSFSAKISKFLTDIGHKFSSLVGNGNEYSDIMQPLSNTDIEDYLKNNVAIVKYSDLDNFKDIDDVFKKSDNVVILYELSNINNGHWVCMRRDKKNNIIYYYDSYGDVIEDELKHATDKAKDLVDLSKGKLLNKLFNSDYTIDYNNVKFQKNNSNACGKYACVFLDSKMSVDDFNNYIISMCKDFNKTPDDIINLIYNSYK